MRSLELLKPVNDLSLIIATPHAVHTCCIHVVASFHKDIDNSCRSAAFSSVVERPSTSDVLLFYVFQ